MILKFFYLFIKFYFKKIYAFFIYIKWIILLFTNYYYIKNFLFQFFYN